MTRYSSSRRVKDRVGRHDNGESWATCGPCGKRVYPSKKAARAVQRAVRAGNERAGRPTVSDDATLRPYRACGTGNGWHVGHETTGGRANRNDGRLTFLDESA